MRYKRPTLAFLIFSSLLLTGPSSAQVGGYGTYKFLGVSSSARVAGMGGNFLAVNDNDLSLTLANPSLIRPQMSGNAALGYVNIPGGIHYGFVAYAHDFSKAGAFVGSLQYVNYGKFKGADASGNLTGEFGVSEYALSIGWGRQLMPILSIGANGKLIYSQLESYRSFGIAVDVSGTYTSKDQAFTASLLGRNIGTQIVPYLAGQYEPLPFELQIGLSEKLKHLPLRFSQLITHLNRWDLTYFDSADPANKADPITGEVREKSGAGKIADGVMRHIVIGAELTIAKVLDLRIGYNYQRRQELKLTSRAGLTGFTFGAGLRVKMFNLGYTRGSYTAGIPMNYLSLGVNFNEFTKKQ